VLVAVHASGYTPGELTWDGTWTDRSAQDRTPSVPGHDAWRGDSARVFGPANWTRDGTLAEYVAIEARNVHGRGAVMAL
jgi:NADPH:quinone reductase-like Zn-dependent oxidoreductase